MSNKQKSSRHLPRCFTFCALVVGLTACQGQEPENGRGSPEESGQVVFRTTPLANDPISDACYTLRAFDGDGGALWQVENACSGQNGGFGGFEGSLEYVGFCDAAKPTTTITLELDSISDDTGTVIDPADYENPCPPDSSDCSVQVNCVANEDVQAFLPITVLETGDKGFIDVEVDIDSITCSAKLDCFAAGQPGFNLEDDVGNALDTIVVGLTCETDVCIDNHLYMNDLVLACDQDGNGSLEFVVSIDPSTPGSIDPVSLPTPVERAVVYTGESVDELTRYANLALGIAAGQALDCRVTHKATLSQLPLPAASTPSDAVYPHIDWDVAITDTAGVLTCTEHPLNAEGSGVSTLFTGLDAGTPVSFAHELAETCTSGGQGGSAEHKIVFTTSERYTGDFGGLSAGDAHCQALADAAGLQGSYLAWLSDSADSPSTRFTQASVPYQLLDGQIVANNYTELVNSGGIISANLGLDETGQALSGDNSVWTGTNDTGTGLPGHCGGWTDSGLSGQTGIYTALDPGWTAFDVLPCSGTAHLYCFEQ